MGYIVTYKNCVNCKHRAYDTFGRAHVCVNADSEYVADFVSDEDHCECHEEKEMPTKLLDVDEFKKWLEEQRKGIKANSEVYTDYQEVLDALDVTEKYIDDNSLDLQSISHFNYVATQK
jgi:hypothetical protein